MRFVSAVWSMVVSSAVIAAGLQANGPPQSADRPVGSALILGRVVDADSRTGVGGVVVTLTKEPLSLAMADPVNGRRVVITDAQGQFVFSALTNGRYSLTATTGGNGYSPSGFLLSAFGQPTGAYLNGGFGQRRPDGPLEILDLEDDVRLPDVEIRLWKSAAIEGTVVDEADEALVNVAVAAVRRTTEGRLLTGPTTRTDDRGAYRLSTLAPGDYVVVVPQSQTIVPVTTAELAASGSQPALGARIINAGGPAPNVRGLAIGSSVVSTFAPSLPTNTLPPVERDNRTFVYQSTFFPAATIAARATPLPLRAGETRRGVTVRLSPVAAYAVAGTLVESGQPVANFGVRLLPADNDDGSGVLDVASSVTDARGEFQFPLVPPGRYRVVAQRRAPPPAPGRGAQPAAPVAPSSIADMAGAWAAQSVAVADRDVTGVLVTLRAGFQLRGRVDFQGSTPVPPANRLRGLRLVLEPIQPLFRDSQGTPGSGPLETNGEFTIEGILPGRHVVNVIQAQIDSQFPGWSLASVVWKGRDITSRPVAIDADIADVLVTFVDRPASLAGTVSAAAGQDASIASVFVFPADRSLWRDARAGGRIFRTVRVSRTGTFVVGDLPPGEYLVAAARDEAAGAWPDTALLSSLATSATPVRVNPGTRATVALRVTVFR